MIYTKIQNEHQHITNQIKNLTSELAKYPNGHLTHARNGNYYKWYHSDGKTNTYIPAQNIEFARQLAIKKYLTLKLEDLKQEQRALEYYLRHHKTIPGKADMLLQNTPGIQALISPYFKPISQDLYDWVIIPLDSYHESYF